MAWEGVTSCGSAAWGAGSLCYPSSTRPPQLLTPLTLVSVAPCLPGNGPTSLNHGISTGYDGIHASDRTSLNSCRTFRHESPAS